MNNKRRREIYEIAMKLLSMKNKDIDALNDIIKDIDYIQDEEEDYRDNIPENMQGGSRYERADEACDNLSYASSYVSEAIDSDDWNEYLQKAVEHLNDARI